MRMCLHKCWRDRKDGPYLRNCVILSSACCFGGKRRHLQSFGTILRRRGELLIRLAISVVGVVAAKPNPAGLIDSGTTRDERREAAIGETRDAYTAPIHAPTDHRVLLDRFKGGPEILGAVPR
jgi:hypothetical protein